MKNCMFSIIFQNCRCVTGRIFILHHPPVIWQLYSSSNVAIPCRRLNSVESWHDFLNQTYTNERHFNRSISACPLIFSVDWSCEKSCLWKYVPKSNLQCKGTMVAEQGIEKITNVSHIIFCLLSFVYLKTLIFLVILTNIKKKKLQYLLFFFWSVSLNMCNLLYICITGLNVLQV